MHTSYAVRLLLSVVTRLRESYVLPSPFVTCTSTEAQSSQAASATRVCSARPQLEVYNFVHQHLTDLNAHHRVRLQSAYSSISFKEQPRKYTPHVN